MEGSLKQLSEFLLMKHSPKISLFIHSAEAIGEQDTLLTEVVLGNDIRGIYIGRRNFRGAKFQANNATAIIILYF